MTKAVAQHREKLARRLNSCDATHRQSPRSIAMSTPGSKSRQGVTLIELLLVITIIATLSATFLGVSRSAMEHANEARTKTTIAKIHGLLMDRLETYTTRRVDIHPKVLQRINNSFSDPLDRKKARADVRLIATRELMKFEMPDRWSDVDLSSSPLWSNSSSAFLARPPSLAQSYYRRLQSSLEVTDNDYGVLNANASAECLFMTVMLATGDGEARALFSQQDIGDTDGDGAQEFLDGWGNPIRWVRWPAGFFDRSDLMIRDSGTNHDPFDPFRRHSEDATPPANAFERRIRPYIAQLRIPDDPITPSNPTGTDYISGFRLVPLVFSAGPDGIGDISTRTANIADYDSDELLNPYAIDPKRPRYEFGSWGDNPADPDGDDNSLDNIHNHLLDGR